MYPNRFHGSYPYSSDPKMGWRPDQSTRTSLAVSHHPDVRVQMMALSSVRGGWFSFCGPPCFPAARAVPGPSVGAGGGQRGSVPRPGSRALWCGKMGGSVQRVWAQTLGWTTGCGCLRLASALLPALHTSTLPRTGLPAGLHLPARGRTSRLWAFGPAPPPRVTRLHDRRLVPQHP